MELVDRYPQRITKNDCTKRKNELRGIMMEEFVGPKMYSYPTYYGKKAEFTKRCIIKLKIKFAYFKNCMENNKTIQKSRQSFSSEIHNVFTEKVNKAYIECNIISK